MQEFESTDHIRDPVRDRIYVRAVWTRHRSFVYVDLDRCQEREGREEAV